MNDKVKYAYYYYLAGRVPMWVARNKHLSEFINKKKENSIIQQHQEICELANELLKQRYIEETGKNPKGIEFFKFDKYTNITAIFQWPNKIRPYCRIVIFRWDMQRPNEDFYLIEIFNIAHELGHFVDFEKGYTFDTVNINEKTTFINKIKAFWCESKADFYALKFIKNNKMLFLGFSILCKSNLFAEYFMPRFVSKITRNFLIWYNYNIIGR